jgi:endo-1,4-beta-xylanase
MDVHAWNSFTFPLILVSDQDKRVVTPGPAAASLLTTGRTAAWNGPARNLLGTLVTGATYVVEAHVRRPVGQPAVAGNATVQRTPDGGSTVFERVAGAASVTDATGGARTAVRTWQDPTGLSYLNTSRWGVVRLAT